MKTSIASLWLRSLPLLLVFCLEWGGGLAYATLAYADSQDLPASPDLPNLLTIERKTEAFHQNLGFKLTATPNLPQSGVDTALTGQILGQSRSLIQFNVHPSTDLSSAQSEVYVRGLQLLGPHGSGSDPTGKIKFENGAFTTHVSLPPVTTRIPLVTLPVGPLLVRVAAGFALAGDLVASLAPQLGIPIQMSMVRANIDPSAQALGFIEGYASLVALRGGMGGEVNVLDAHASLQADLYLGNRPARFRSSGFLEFLNGEFYGFLDHFNLWKWKWTRFWKNTLFSWKGVCLDLNQKTDHAGKCVKP